MREGRGLRRGPPRVGLGLEVVRAPFISFRSFLKLFSLHFHLPPPPHSARYTANTQKMPAYLRRRVKDTWLVGKTEVRMPYAHKKDSGLLQFTQEEMGQTNPCSSISRAGGALQSL